MLHIKGNGKIKGLNKKIRKRQKLATPIRMRFPTVCSGGGGWELWAQR